LDLPEGAVTVLAPRCSDVIYPRGHTRLQTGDRPTLMGSTKGDRVLARLCRWVTRPPPKGMV
jgi:hypothetical protein